MPDYEPEAQARGSRCHLLSAAAARKLLPSPPAASTLHCQSPSPCPPSPHLRRKLQFVVAFCCQRGSVMKILLRAPLAILLLSLFAALAVAADPTPGLVKEQPTTGRFVKTDQGFMVPYQQTIPGTDASFEMQPIPGGKFLLGSPDSEQGRKPDEGPQVEVEIEPFWMSTHEVTWSEYKQYMDMYKIFKKLAAAKLQPSPPDSKHQIVTAPSSLYDPTFTFKLGD